MRVGIIRTTSTVALTLLIIAGVAAPLLLAQAESERQPQPRAEAPRGLQLQGHAPEGDCCARTKFQVLISKQMERFETPFGGSYEVAFDEVIETEGYSEIRVWVHVFVDGYQAHPVTSQAKLDVRFMHVFPGGQFDYAKSTIKWNNVTSYINGYVVKPILGDKLRLLCTPKDLPPGPYRVSATYLLVR